MRWLRRLPMSWVRQAWQPAASCIVQIRMNIETRTLLILEPGSVLRFKCRWRHTGARATNCSGAHILTAAAKRHGRHIWTRHVGDTLVVLVEA